MPLAPKNPMLPRRWFEDSLPEFLKKDSDPVRIINIDHDIYSSTKTVLGVFAEQIIPGTILICNKYIGFQRRREDEFKAFQEGCQQPCWEFEDIGFSFMTRQRVIRLFKAWIRQRMAKIYRYVLTGTTLYMYPDTVWSDQF